MALFLLIILALPLFSYKLGLVRTLVDRVYKINSTWLGFHGDFKELTMIIW